MAWETKIVSQEKVEDTNPDLYLRRAEEALRTRRIPDALYEADKAVRYSNNGSHYIFEKVKILYHCERYGEVIYLVRSNMDRFKRDFTREKYREALSYYMKANIKRGNILEVLKAGFKVGWQSPVLARDKTVLVFFIIAAIIFKLSGFGNAGLPLQIYWLLFYGAGPGLALGGKAGSIFIIINFLFNTISGGLLSLSNFLGIGLIKEAVILAGILLLNLAAAAVINFACERHMKNWSKFIVISVISYMGDALIRLLSTIVYAGYYRTGFADAIKSAFRLGLYYWNTEVIMYFLIIILSASCIIYGIRKYRREL